MATRHITISRLYRDNLHDGRRTSTSVLPTLRLTGRWLEQAGFHPGEKVKILVENGRLVITSSKGKEVSP